MPTAESDYERVNRICFLPNSKCKCSWKKIRKLALVDGCGPLHWVSEKFLINEKTKFEKASFKKRTKFGGEKKLFFQNLVFHLDGPYV